MAAPQNRHKISTTVAPETYAALERMVKTGRAATLAEAVDQAVAEVLREESRRRLEQDTAAQFAALSAAPASLLGVGLMASMRRPAAEPAMDDAQLERALGEAADEIKLDE